MYKHIETIEIEEDVVIGIKKDKEGKKILDKEGKVQFVTGKVKSKIEKETNRKKVINEK
jgi:hypothetical protein